MRVVGFIFLFIFNTFALARLPTRSSPDDVNKRNLIWDNPPQDSSSKTSRVCESGPAAGLLPPGGRSCYEPWYNETDDPRAHQTAWHEVHMVHGIFMAAPFSIFFPLGALAPHLGLFGGAKMKVHRGCMWAGAVSLVLGFSSGCLLAQMSGRMWNDIHQIFGTLIMAMVLTAFVLGRQHQQENAESRTWVWFCHCWVGRILILCGIVNAVKGLLMAHNWIIAGLTFFVFFTLVFAGTYFFFSCLIIIQEAWHHKTWKSIFFYPKRLVSQDGEHGLGPDPSSKPTSGDMEKKQDDHGRSPPCHGCCSAKKSDSSHPFITIGTAAASKPTCGGQNGGGVVDNKAAAETTQTGPDIVVASLQPDANTATNAQNHVDSPMSPRRVLIRLDDPAYLVGAGRAYIRRYC